jgi:CheY-like chemotaxis protein
MKKKIVIVDDNPVLISIYQNKFNAEGFQVEVALNGHEGLELIYSVKPDLVLLDLMMPKVNGLEVLKKLRENPLYQALPVIIFSNSAWVAQAWKEGATMVVSKSNHSPKWIVQTALYTLETSGYQPVATNPAIESAAPALIPPAHLWRRLPMTGQILLAEDHADTRALASVVLIQAGYQVTAVESHAAALHEAGTKMFDLYILNRFFSDASGLSLCRQLRQSYPHKPIIIYSTEAVLSEPQEALDAGASLYVSRPEDILNLAEIASKLIEELRPRDDVENQTAALRA